MWSLTVSHESWKCLITQITKTKWCTIILNYIFAATLLVRRLVNLKPSPSICCVFIFTFLSSKYRIIYACTENECKIFLWEKWMKSWRNVALFYQKRKSVFVICLFEAKQKTKKMEKKVFASNLRMTSSLFFLKNKFFSLHLLSEWCNLVTLLVTVQSRHTAKQAVKEEKKIRYNLTTNLKKTFF